MKNQWTRPVASYRAPMRPIRFGDHLRVYRAGYYHHGIGLGDGRVVHYTDVRPDKRAAIIRIGSIEEFRAGGRIEVVSYAYCDTAEVVVARARSRCGEARYHVARNNCEHFARWCKTGQSSSDQVRAATANVGGAAAGAASAARGIATVSAAGVMEGLSGPGVLSGLRAVGARVGAGAVGGLGLLAATPAVAATVAVHHRYADDPYLPADERDARRAARSAGTVGAVGGGATSIAAVAALGIPGLSGPGIATGLASLGAVLGGGMVAGMAVVAALPLVGAALLSRNAHRARLRPAH